MVMRRKPNETDAEYLARIANDHVPSEGRDVEVVLNVGGVPIATLKFEGEKATVSIERNSAGIVVVVFSEDDDGPPDRPFAYSRAGAGGYPGSHTHLWRKVEDGRPGKPPTAWRLVRAVGWIPDDITGAEWTKGDE
jgi:hypothetical protein